MAPWVSAHCLPWQRNPVCVCVCVCVCINLYIHTYIHTNIHKDRETPYTCIQIHMYTNISNTYTYTQIHMYTNIHVYKVRETPSPPCRPSFYPSFPFCRHSHPPWAICPWALSTRFLKTNRKKYDIFLSFSSSPPPPLGQPRTSPWALSTWSKETSKEIYK